MSPTQPHDDTVAARERRVSSADRLAWAKERVITASRLLLATLQAGDNPQVYQYALGERLREHDEALVALSRPGPRKKLR